MSNKKNRLWLIGLQNTAFLHSVIADTYILFRGMKDSYLKQGIIASSHIKNRVDSF